MTTRDRLTGLLEQARTLISNSEMRGGLAMVDRGGFGQFRSGGLSVLKAQFGAEHPHFTQFESQVQSPTQSRVEIGVGILKAALQDVESPLEAVAPSSGILLEDLLHPAIKKAAFKQFQDEHYRDAILNCVIAIFDLLRERTNLNGDGATLVASALSLENPKLILGDLSTESGKNEQKGMIQILQGVYLAIRNPKAHTLVHDPKRHVAAQYMVFTSLLARRLSEARTSAV